MDDVENVEINGEQITVGRLLKLVGAADTGGAVKQLLAEGAVQVDGRVETRRGAQLQDGALIECAGRRFRVAAAG